MTTNPIPATGEYHHRIQSPAQPTQTIENPPETTSISSSFTYSKDFLAMRKYHLVHFIPSNYEFISETSKELLEQDRFSIDSIKEIPVNVGEAVALKHGQYYVFHLAVKENPSAPEKLLFKELFFIGMEV
ncbi:hypothetical protein KQX54_001181 [Cotesia glomerata]|uniref:Uncharacterized protein n=1 Tax=Cotesia glomerata TaxID=32391 RepID=A0AAV7ILH5_COTGL|nr:hypothetical protein KQX54_001181 [Cotesia glomerata]